MIIKGARHRIKPYYWMTMNISKEYYHHRKYIERLMCTLAFELFIVNGCSELKANNRWWSEVACVVFSQFLPSFHTSSRLLCVDSLFFIVGLTHLDYENCSFIIHRVRTRSIRAIEYHLLCVIHRGLLQTSPCARCCWLVSLFSSAPRIFLWIQAFEFLHVWSNESIAQDPLRRRPHLHYLVLIVLLLPLPWGFPLCT
jgi:hypothetical protein